MNGELLVRDRDVHRGAWNFLWYEEAAEHPDFHLLTDFVEVLVRRFGLDDRIPACWASHDGMVEELAQVYREYVRLHAGDPSEAGASVYDLGAEDVAEPATGTEEPPHAIEDTDEMDPEPEDVEHDEGADSKAHAESQKRDSDALLTGETTDWVWKLDKALERMTHLYHAADCQREHRERRFSRWSMKLPIAPTGLLAAAVERERAAQRPPSALDLLA